MRKIVFILLLLTILIFMGAFMLFAQENQPKQDNPLKQTFEGKILIDNRILPELISSKESLKLMVPPFIIDELDIKDNDSIKVEGYKKEDYIRNRFFRVKKDTIFIVTKINFKGKEIDLEKEFLNRPFDPAFERGSKIFNKAFKWGGFRCPYHW